MICPFSDELTSATAIFARSRSSGAGRGVIAGYRCFEGMSQIVPWWLATEQASRYRSG